MTISSLKDLQKLMALCRKQGVKSLTVGDITFELGEQAFISTVKPSVKASSEVYVPGAVGPDTKIELPDELTPEQLLFYSADMTEEQAN
jgi:hypothetical protein